MARSRLRGRLEIQWLGLAAPVATWIEAGDVDEAEPRSYAPDRQEGEALSVGYDRSFRRPGARIGKAKAVTATARKIAVLFYNALRHGMDYADPGASAYEERYRQRVINSLERRVNHGAKPSLSRRG